MRYLTLALTLSAAPAWAELPLGCFTRDYSNAHLAENPNQHVASLKLLFTRGADTMYPRFLQVEGRFADQGRARLDRVQGQAFHQSAFCTEEAGQPRCQVECDGGGLAVHPLRGDTLDVSTDYFVLEYEGCEALSDLAELGGGETTYRLTRAPESACSGM